MNTFDLFQEAIREARSVRNMASRMSDTLAGLLIDIGMRNVSPGHLRRMKRMLQDFNSTTGSWKY